MRPIEKYRVGTVLTMDDGTSHVVMDEYMPYGAAKPVLCHNFGCGCVYCEAVYPYERDLHVEHILPKDPKLGYSHLEFKWDNFLLGCATCNGTDNKGNTVALPGDCHFPHLNNTFLSLRYDAGGVVTVNPMLTGLSRTKAQTLLTLVGLDKTPRTSSPGDRRCMKRKETWDLACRYRNKYLHGCLDIDCLIDFIRLRGYWSIWFTVFEGIDEVRKRMIYDFPGTDATCFDATAGYSPVERNPGMIDPV